MLVSLHDKATIEAFARKNPFVHLFKISDLDDFFWQYTLWYGWQVNADIAQLCLMYTAPPVPTLLIYPEVPDDTMRSLLTALLKLLPRKFYAHLPPDMLDVFTPLYDSVADGLHKKMGLTDSSRIRSFDVGNVVQMTHADSDRLKALYTIAHPDNIFDKRMLETGRYYGVREGDSIVSVAGIHAYSFDYKVAVLGNVTTHPDYRGRGLGTGACAKLCQVLHDEGIVHIGLNVRSDNAGAIRIYERLGFETVLEFGTYTFTSKAVNAEDI